MNRTAASIVTGGVVMALTVAAVPAGLRTHVDAVLAQGVAWYCAVPVETRHLVRAQADRAVAPHAIRIDCAADHAADVGLPTPPPAP